MAPISPINGSSHPIFPHPKWHLHGLQIELFTKVRQATHQVSTWKNRDRGRDSGLATVTTRGSAVFHPKPWLYDRFISGMTYRFCGIGFYNTSDLWNQELPMILHFQLSLLDVVSMPSCDFRKGWRCLPLQWFMKNNWEWTIGDSTVYPSNMARFTCPFNMLIQYILLRLSESNNGLMTGPILDSHWNSTLFPGKKATSAAEVVKVTNESAASWIVTFTS